MDPQEIDRRLKLIADSLRTIRNRDDRPTTHRWANIRVQLREGADMIDDIRAELENQG